MWVIPDINTCNHLLHNALLLDPNEKELLSYVLDFKHGILDKIAFESEKELEKYGIDPTDSTLLKQFYAVPKRDVLYA
jgi:hypothetical protein